MSESENKTSAIMPSKLKCRVTEGTGGLASTSTGDGHKNSNAGNKCDEKDLYYFTVDKVTEEDLKKVKQKKVEVNGETIALISHGNKIFAIQEKCPHYGGPLHQGEIEEVPPLGLCIRCPWHSWKFSLETGKCVSPPRDDKFAKVYPVKVTGSSREIKIGFESISESIFNATPP